MMHFLYIIGHFYATDIKVVYMHLTSVKMGCIKADKKQSFLYKIHCQYSDSFQSFLNELGIKKLKFPNYIVLLLYYLRC